MQNGQDMKSPLCNNLCLGELAQCWFRNTEDETVYSAAVWLNMAWRCRRMSPRSYHPVWSVSWNYIVIELRKSYFINTLVGLSYRWVTRKQGPMLKIGFRGYPMASLALGLAETKGLLVYSKSIYLIVTRMDVRPDTGGQWMAFKSTKTTPKWFDLQPSSSSQLWKF